jgi:hypothetical protein
MYDLLLLKSHKSVGDMPCCRHCRPLVLLEMLSFKFVLVVTDMGKYESECRSWGLYVRRVCRLTCI